eukprot:3315947-Pyramimonas_sp.AAC.1
MSDNGKGDASQTESDSSLDAKNQRRKERETDVEKDANSSKKDSKRSTRARAEADRSTNGPIVTRGDKRREDAHSGGASAPTTARQATTKADATEWQKVEHKHNIARLRSPCVWMTKLTTEEVFFVLL